MIMQQVFEMAVADALAEYQDEFWNKSGDVVLKKLKKLGYSTETIEMFRGICDSAFHCGATMGAQNAISLTFDYLMAMKKGDKK